MILGLSSVHGGKSKTERTPAPGARMADGERWEALTAYNVSDEPSRVHHGRAAVNDAAG